MKFKAAFIFFIAVSLSTSIGYAGEWVDFKSVSKSASFVLKGILTKPTGQGQFPAIVLLHGVRWTQSFGQSGKHVKL